MSHLGNHIFSVPVNNMWNGTFLHNSWMNRFVMIRCEKTIQQNDTLTIGRCSFLQWVLGTALHKWPLLKKQRVRRVQSLYWRLFTVNEKGLVFSEVCSDSFWLQSSFKIIKIFPACSLFSFYLCLIFSCCTDLEQQRTAWKLLQQRFWHYRKHPPLFPF